VNGNAIGLTTVMWDGVLSKLWKRLTLVHLVPHSLRKSAVKWGARCFGQDWEIRNNSGHAPKSTSWLRYIEEGVTDRNEATMGDNGTRRRDPIFSVWTWRPVTFAPRGH